MRHYLYLWPCCNLSRPSASEYRARAVHPCVCGAVRRRAGVFAALWTRSARALPLSGTTEGSCRLTAAQAQSTPRYVVTILSFVQLHVTNCYFMLLKLFHFVITYTCCI